MSHSPIHAGLQNHSVGASYPWSIKIIGNGPGIVQAYNAITGKLGPRNHFNTMNDGSFEIAHATAEADALAGLRNDNREAAFSNFGEDSSPAVVAAIAGKSLLEFSILIPVVRDDNRAPHSEAAWNWLHDELLRLYGGYTIGHNVRGYWRSEAGEDIADTSAQFFVAAENGESLYALAALACRNFAQQCIYVKQSATDARLIAYVA